MPIAASLMLLGSAVAEPIPVTLDALAATFEKVCVNPVTIAAQRKAASDLPDVTSEEISSYDKKREPRVPGVRYRTPNYKIGIFGYRDAGNCSVTTLIDPKINADDFSAFLRAHFGRKLHKEYSTDGFYRGDWLKGERQFSFERLRKGGTVVGLLTVRKRDGFYG